VFSQILAVNPRYPYRFDRYANIRWEKLPAPMRTFFRTVLGKERYERAETPRLYDKPRTVMLAGSLCMTVVFGCLVYAARSRRSARPAAVGDIS
jgi:hypothetical protein